MKGGPTDPPNAAAGNRLGGALPPSMKGGPTDPPNPRGDVKFYRNKIAFNEGGAY